MRSVVRDPTLFAENFMGFLQKIFGSKNQRELKKLQPLVERINELEPKMKAKSDAELKAMTGEFKQRLDNGATLDDILPEAFAVVREAGVRRARACATTTSS